MTSQKQNFVDSSFFFDAVKGKYVGSDSGGPVSNFVEGFEIKNAEVVGPINSYLFVAIITYRNLRQSHKITQSISGLLQGSALEKGKQLTRGKSATLSPIISFPQIEIGVLYSPK